MNEPWTSPGRRRISKPSCGSAALLLMGLSAICAVAYAQSGDTRPQKPASALIPGIDRIDLGMSFAQVREAFPSVQWTEAANDMENRYQLSAKHAVSVSGVPFSLTLSAGESGIHQLFAIWSDHELTEERCLNAGITVVAELEKQFGTLSAAPQSAWSKGVEFTPVTFRSMSAGSGSAITIRKEELVKTVAGDIGGYVEWRSRGMTADGKEVVAGGTYYGASSLAKQKGDCSAWAEITNTRVQPRRIQNTSSAIISPPR